MPKSKANFTYKVIYSEKHHIVLTTPKGWARENKEKFPTFTFVKKDVPKTPAIAKRMTDEFGFSKKETPELMVLYRFEQ